MRKWNKTKEMSVHVHEGGRFREGNIKKKEKKRKIHRLFESFPDDLT